jgi:hypothetical protein
MLGTICKRDILAHPFVTIQCFGWAVFFKALTARPNQTFLSLLADSGVLQTAEANVPRLVKRSIQLELRASHIYQSLATRYANERPVRSFFENLASQELDHAELLRLCGTTVARGHWNAKSLDVWTGVVPELERQMNEAELSFDRFDSMSDALQLVIRLESSEVNRIFLSVVVATKSDFVAKMNVFWDSVSKHISYACRQICQLDSSLTEECQVLKALCFDDTSAHNTNRALLNLGIKKAVISEPPPRL